MKEKINRILRDILDLREDYKIQPEFRLREDLGLDSLQLAQLTVEIEDEFGIDIFEDENVQTIYEIYEKLK